MFKDFVKILVVKNIVKKLDEKAVADAKAKMGDLALLGTDAGLDYLEEYIKRSKTKVDDALLPLIVTVRAVLNIPDDDKEEDDKTKGGEATDVPIQER